MGKDIQDRGTHASSAEFARFDQVRKPDYHLAESADEPDVFDEDFTLTTLDLARCLRGNQEDQAIFAGELGAALTGLGFAVLEGHGLAPELFSAAQEEVRCLFEETPLDVKMRYLAQRHGSVKEGYFPVRETSDIHPDLVEGWVFGRRAFNFDSHSGFDATAFWPAASHELTFRRLVQATRPLVLPIMRAILRFLGNDPYAFDDRLADADFGQRLNYYPALSPEDLATGAGRLLGHEDVDLFTFLPAPTEEGLQALGPKGKWVRLAAPEGSIILNTGDYMQRLSNDVLPSTTHRVSPPRDPEAVRRPRVSFPMAAYLRPEEILAPLPGLGAPKYDPIRVLTFHTRTTAKFYGEDYAVE